MNASDLTTSEIENDILSAFKEKFLLKINSY